MAAPQLAEPNVSADIRTGARPFELYCVGAWVLRTAAQLERRLDALSVPRKANC